jgi:hypothetical protein
MRLRCAQELRELLPWYANGTLTEEEHIKVLSAESVPEPPEELFTRTVERIHAKERHTIAQLSWQIFALGFSLGVLYERGRVRLEPELETLGWKFKRKG